MVDTSILESFIWSFLGIVVESLPFIIIGSLVSAIIQVFLTEELMDTSILESFIWSFLGIVVESLPFIIIGSLVSAIIQVFLTEELIRKFIPKVSILGYLGAILSGILFPICECAIVPITRSLIKKGLPVGIGISFMLAVPIVNPIVIMSTYYAFPNNISVVLLRTLGGALIALVPVGIGISFMLAVPIVNPIVIMSTYYAFPNNISVVLLRTLGGALIALVVGLIMGYLYNGKKKELILKENIMTIRCECCVSNKFTTSKREKIINLINHGSNEFLNISVYFIIGAFLSSVFAALMNNEVLARINTNNLVGVLFMIALSFILSLCSEADAFVVKGFLDNFGVGAIVGFLIMGPMMDLKNAFLAFGVFNNRFASRLVLFITIFVTALALLISIV